VSSLPLADVDALRPAALRTSVLRACFAAGLLLAVTAAYLLAPSGGSSAAAAAGGRGTVVVLDVSGSVDNDAQTRLVRRLLDREMRSGGNTGLVLFSDTAVEALPPSAPASELARFRRFFVPLKRPAPSPVPTANDVAYPPSPWQEFVGGTAISAGLREARLALARAGLRGGTIVLVSDLVDAASDLPRLRRELAVERRNPALNVQVRVLPADLPQARQPFVKAFGPASVRPGRAAPETLRPPRRPLPVWLLAAAALAAAALGAYELLAVPLRWGGAPRAAR
jgi:hypothetical protein